jgi:hypothetical protein
VNSTQANIGSQLISIDRVLAREYLTAAYEGRLQTLGPDHRDPKKTQETLHAVIDRIQSQEHQSNDP